MAETLVDFRTAPDRYRHWKLSTEGSVAYLTMDVNEDGGLRPPLEREDGTVATSALAAAAGAWCVRAHCVRANLDAVKVAHRWARGRSEA